MFRTLSALAAIFLVALALVALTFRASALRPADFRFINGTEPKTLDPGLLTGQPGGRVASAIFEGLARYDAATLEPVPGAAESWSVSADGRTYVFSIRRDARWSDGRAVTAHDFAYAWRRLQDPMLGSEYAYILHMIRFAKERNVYAAQADRLAGPVLEALDALRAEGERGVPAAAWQEFLQSSGALDAAKEGPDAALRDLLARSTGRLSAAELGGARALFEREARRLRALNAEANRRFGIDAGVFARDDHTLVVELVAPAPYFLALTAFYPALPIPRWVVEAEGNARDWFLPGKIVSNGPFRLESWLVNDRIRLVRNETYWGRDQVSLEVIDVLPIEDPTTSLNLYLSGEVDWLPANYPSDLVDPLRARDDFYSTAGLGIYYYKFNCERPPFDDPRMRKAVNLAIDREEIARDVLRLGQIPAAHMVPPGMAGYTAPPSRIRRDLDEARRLLAEAGHPEGAGLGEIGILYNTNESHKKIAEVIADQLRRELGLDVKAYNQEWQSYLATVRQRDYDMARAGWIGDYVDPNTFLDMWITDGGNNQTGWGSTTYDRLIEAAGDIEGFLRESGSLLRQVEEPEALRAGIASVERAQGAAARRSAGARLRMQLLREAEAILVQDAFPVLPIYFYVNSGLLRAEVSGFYNELVWPDGRRAWNLQGLHPLRGIRVARRPAGAGG